jgi:hypothetical protein
MQQSRFEGRLFLHYRTANNSAFRRERWAVVPPRPLPLLGLPTGMTTVITNAYGDSCAYLQIRRTCVAGCAIGPWDGAYSGAFSRAM